MKKLIISLVVVMATFVSSFAYTHGISAQIYTNSYYGSPLYAIETYNLNSSTLVFYDLSTNNWGSGAYFANNGNLIDYVKGTSKTGYWYGRGTISVYVHLYWDYSPGDYVSAIAHW